MGAQWSLVLVRRLAFALSVSLTTALLCAGGFADSEYRAWGTDEVIPDEEGVRRYSLSNGLEVVVVASDQAAGLLGRDRVGDRDRVQVWLVVRGGTMDELDGERGAANLSERVLRQGFDGLDADEIDSMLSVGEEGSQQYRRGSIVTIHQTMLTGHVSGDDPAELERLLGLYARVLDPRRWDTGDERIEDARASLLGLVERAMSPEMRARQRWLGRLLGEGLLGRRLDLPEIDEIERLDRATLMRYAERVYRPSRATLIVVGSGDGLRIDKQIGKALGGLDELSSGAVSDLRAGLGHHHGFVFEREAGIEADQAALVWVREREDVPSGSWSVDAGRFDESAMRRMLIERVAEELIGNRVERLGVATLGSGVELSVDRFELGGQLDLLQCVAQGGEGERGSWEALVAHLVRECDRLVRDGAGSEEIARARGTLLARWHRDANDWRSESNRDRAWLLHWLVTSGRPVIGAAAWDEWATRLMTTISDREIVQAVRELVDPARARVLVVTGYEEDSEPDTGLGVDADDARLASFVEGLRSGVAEPLAADWMRTLGGALLDQSEFDGRVERVTQHARSGVWGAELGNGVRLWARETTGDRDGRIELCATVSGAMFGDGSLSEDEISAAMLAWREPSSESRGARWLAVFAEAHGLEVRASRIVGGVRLRVRAPEGGIESALGLMYLLLDRPMIDPGAFERWQGRNAEIGNPIDLGLAMLYRPELVQESDRAGVTIDDAQRTLTRMVRNARIEVGIAGSVSPGPVVERAGQMLGELVARRVETRSVAMEPEPLVVRERSVEVDWAGEDSRLVLGVVGGELGELEQLRASILASLVLGDRARELARARGMSGDGIDAQVVMSEALGGRWALLIWAGGDDLNGGTDRVERVLHEAVEELLSEGISEEQLERAKQELDESIGWYFDLADYWSSRMSTLGHHGRSVDDLWTIREGYASVGVDAASAGLREAFARDEHMRIVVQGRDDR